MSEIDIKTAFSDFQKSRETYLLNQLEITNLITRRNEIENNIRKVLAESEASRREWEARLHAPDVDMTQEFGAFSEREASRKMMADEMRIAADKLNDDIHFITVKHARSHSQYNGCREVFLKLYTEQQSDKAKTDLYNVINKALARYPLSRAVDLKTVLDEVSKRILADYSTLDKRHDDPECACAFADEGATIYSGNYGSALYLGKERQRLNINQ